MVRPYSWPFGQGSAWDAQKNEKHDRLKSVLLKPPASALEFLPCNGL
jgi:hypothetical protein